jgi:hypothetical protein
MALPDNGLFKRRQELLDLAGSRLEKLLQQSPDPQADMSMVESMLSEANLLGNSPSRHSLRHWVANVIEDNPELWEQSSPWMMEHDHKPQFAKSVHELITSLIPSEGGL